MAAVAADSIERPYLLVIHIPAYVDAAGNRWVGDLWHKDLVRHVDYLGNFWLACPHIFAPPPPKHRSLEGYPINFVPLPRAGGQLRNVLAAPRNVFALWRAISHADIVHATVGHWNPLALYNLTFAITMLQSKFRLIVVESSTWRLLPGQKVGLRHRVKAAVAEIVNRSCVSTADLSLFTQSEYKRSLLRGNSDRGHIINASWVDEADILDESLARAAWSRKQASRPARLLFAGRLAESKGVMVLLEALRLLERERVPVAVDILGAGELEAACDRVVSKLGAGSVRARLIPPIEYGEPFFSTLREYSGVLVPSLGDEQPRIVYDAYSQGVPVLASATPGLRDCVVEGETGRLFSPGDAQALADCIRWAVHRPTELESMGLLGLQKARSLTHAEMHRRRHRIITQSLQGRFPAQGAGAG